VALIDEAEIRDTLPFERIRATQRAVIVGEVSQRVPEELIGVVHG
jgi:hypothetical protein